jgi:hypothetical protein
MLGLFKRKPPADPVVTDRLKLWVSTLMDLSERDTIMLAELACRDPGCLDLETVITVITTDRRRFELRFPGPMAGVTEADVQVLAKGLPHVHTP